MSLKASRFEERFVSTGPGEAGRALVFQIPKTEDQVPPFVVATAMGRLTVEHAQAANQVTLQRQPPRRFWENNYLHWINTEKGCTAAESAVFGLSLPEVDTNLGLSRSRLLSARQVKLGLDGQNRRLMGTLLPDPNMLMFVQGDIRMLGVDALLQWKDLAALLHSPSCGGTTQWQFTKCTFEHGFSAIADRHTLHLVVLPKSTRVSVRSLASNGGDLATVTARDEVSLYCYQATTAAVRCWDPAQLRSLLTAQEGQPLALPELYVGTISRVTRKQTGAVIDHSAGMFATPPKKQRTSSGPKDQPAKAGSPHASAAPRDTSPASGPRYCSPALPDETLEQGGAPSGEPFVHHKDGGPPGSLTAEHKTLSSLDPFHDPGLPGVLDQAHLQAAAAPTAPSLSDPGCLVLPAAAQPQPPQGHSVPSSDSSEIEMSVAPSPEPPAPPCTAAVAPANTSVLGTTVINLEADSPMAPSAGGAHQGLERWGSSGSGPDST